jgi:hypothetical protein
MARPKAARADGLIGMFGHTLNENEEIEWQFRIERAASTGAYVVQLFSWLDGGPTECKVLAREDLLSDHCRLYLTASAMQDAFDVYSRRLHDGC